MLPPPIPCFLGAGWVALGQCGDMTKPAAEVRGCLACSSWNSARAAEKRDYALRKSEARARLCDCSGVGLGRAIKPRSRSIRYGDVMSALRLRSEATRPGRPVLARV